MGHAVGKVLGEHGHRVITNLTDRGAHSRNLAQAGGLEDVGSLESVVAEADLILSILPPAAALNLASEVAVEMSKQGRTPVFVDCNAVSPQTAQAVGAAITDCGAPFIDAGIIGLAPGKGGAPRFYVSGTNVAPMLALNGKGIQVLEAGPEIGQASAMKMAYAALTKGTWTLHTAVMMAAQQLGVRDALISEFEHSQGGALASIRGKVPFLPADSARWVGEMEEIAATFEHSGVTPDFHKGAAAVFRVLEQTPFAAETRADMDRTRSLEDAVETFVQHLPKS
jgi:3-hydroxyisobutyrate dehydrogenase-like beta-hydroxyacid dehydrogenase